MALNGIVEKISTLLISYIDILASVLYVFVYMIGFAQHLNTLTITILIQIKKTSVCIIRCLKTLQLGTDHGRRKWL